MKPIDQWDRPPRTCARCGEEYAPKSNRQSYCGECAHCEQCGRRLTRQDKKRFCSSQCWGESLRHPPIPCGVCGVPVPRLRSRKAVYCSPTCRAASVIGRTGTTSAGYVLERTPEGWKPQHRVVMERALSRPLRSDEAVHHRNGDKADNRLANLELCLVGARAHPPGQRVADLIAWAKGLLDEYGAIDEDVLAGDRPPS